MEFTFCTLFTFKFLNTFIMTLRRIIVFILVFLVMTVFSPFVRAQSSVTIDVDLPNEIVVDEEVAITIEILDEDDELIDDAEVEVDYEPADSVVDQVLLNCGDPNDFDECKVNNRGVDGVYEIKFFLSESPVTVTVTANDVTKDIEVSTGSDTSSSTTGTSSTSSSSSSSSSTVSPGSVQAGPYPSVWLILLPLALLGGVVTFVVVRS